MEILCRGRRIHNMYIWVDKAVTIDIKSIVAHLQETLYATTRMLGPSAVIAVRKEHYQSRLPKPFYLTAGDICINYNLGGIKEISKLCFPDVKVIWCFP